MPRATDYLNQNVFIFSISFVATIRVAGGVGNFVRFGDDFNSFNDRFVYGISNISVNTIEAK